VALTFGWKKAGHDALALMSQVRGFDERPIPFLRALAAILLRSWLQC